MLDASTYWRYFQKGVRAFREGCRNYGNRRTPEGRAFRAGYVTESIR